MGRRTGDSISRSVWVSGCEQDLVGLMTQSGACRCQARSKSLWVLGGWEQKRSGVRPGAGMCGSRGCQFMSRTGVEACKFQGGFGRFVSFGMNKVGKNTSFEMYLIFTRHRNNQHFFHIK